MSRRRSFLQGMAGGTPVLRMLAGAGPAAAAHDSGKFTPLDIGRFRNASPADLGAREQAASFSPDRLIHTPAGSVALRGIPFQLGEGGARSRRWLMLSSGARPWAAASAEVPVGRTAGYLCLAQFCDWEEGGSGLEDVPGVGRVLARAVLVYEDGREHAFSIRRRFEVCPPSTEWGQRALLALAHPQMVPQELDGPLRRATQWGHRQTVVEEDGRPPFLWICALANPEPARPVRSIRFQAAAGDLLAVAGATLFHGKENPLRYERRSIYRISLPEAGAADRWRASVDLGVVARQYALAEFEPEEWLASPGAGLGGPAGEPRGHLYAEVAASPEATLTVENTRTGRRYLFDLTGAAPGRDIPAREGAARVQLIERDRVWVHARVVDAANGRPVPARVAFRSAQGRYIPPYGHRTEINPGWFQDYGADVRVGADSFAYVDGEFQVELPTGDVYVEAAKGFEYQPLRKRLRVEAATREITLEIGKYADLRAQGWVTADTHVHFISPSTAVLEGQAEGLNLINLLAAQWGDLYTSVGDLPHGPIASRDGETVVWPGTENRHHLMGHIGLLGGKGSPVYPLSGGFPYGADEAYLGDPLWTSMSEWADACRAREGVTIAVHFPNPLAELAADIVLGKIDAVEVHVGRSRFAGANFVEWYRYLNCGYRLPIAGGTDKMSANVAVGRLRTYAHIGEGEFSFPAWGKAVRAGNTFSTTGPLLLVRVDGRVPGEEIRLGPGGGTVEVEAQARCFSPIHRLEIVVNGNVAAAREEKGGAREIVLREKVRVPAPGWIAARCESVPGPTQRWGTLAAHTSPLYLVTPGRELFSAPVAAYLMSLIDGTQSWVETIATRADAERYERIRKVLIDARAELQRRMGRG